MILGFTGNRYGMTKLQGEKLLRILDLYNISEFHHGDCVGSDEQSHSLVRKHLPAIRIITHPPTNPRLRANCRGDASEPPRGYMARNHRIVDVSDLLIATPRETQEQIRSGTWATIRYARKTRTALVIIYPDGKVGS